MSYQVLARKWRPNRFSELVGQEHVVKAISNALDNNRLHHAYLFTGTRGVGKTTIARIFSKSLNCETGMSADPCGQCDTCKEIERGSYVDLLEIDAASRTKVEDTRELLDNVQYKPTRGQYKVYLIDEVHMLSKHSFNALLKTLEEPPPHVKFLLATTDPQKLPITILSRCLQFNLKALSREQINQQLEHVLTQENLPFDKQAILQLARAAQGSMRDALSLTDQAIAQGNGEVTNAVVTDMLGLMDKNQILKLVHAIFSGEAEQVMHQVEQISFQAPDYSQVLNEIMSLLHQVALTQFVPDACKLETVSARAVFQLSKLLPAEQVQLSYQIALQGKKDISFAADGRMGLEMTLLRMLAFNPASMDLSIDETNKLAATESKSIPVSSDTNSHSESEVEAQLYDQQQDILAQSEMLRDSTDENLEEQQTQAPPPVIEQEPVVDSIPPVEKLSATESLIALKSKLSQVTEEEGGESPSVKKSEPESKLAEVNLSSLRSTNTLEQKVHAEPVKTELETTDTAASDELPPWSNEIDAPFSEPTAQPESKPETENTTVQETVLFDPNEHLTETTDVKVDFDVPAFLESGQKVVSSDQLDSWSQLIEQMQVAALTKQLALHSSYEKNGNLVTLNLTDSKPHLETDSAKNQLKQALSAVLQQDIELRVTLGKPLNTPFAVQQKINKVRMEHATKVINTDENIVRISDTFTASLVEGTIRAR